jgi:hypothetical protein
VKYWASHKAALVALREKLAKERADRPRDPKTYTATALNPDYQARMRALLEKVAPGGTYEAAKAPEYVEAFRKAVVGDDAKFTVTAEVVGGRIKLTGAVSDRKHHDRLIDLLVAMRLYGIINEVQLPKGDK